MTQYMSELPHTIPRFLRRAPGFLQGRHARGEEKPNEPMPNSNPREVDIWTGLFTSDSNDMK
jgi:hypothetical protein